MRGQLHLRMARLAADKISAAMPSDRELAGFLMAHAKEFKTADGSTPPLGEVRAAVEGAWQRARRQTAIDAAYQKLRARVTRS